MKTLFAGLAFLIAGQCFADTSLIRIDGSPHAKMQNVGLNEVTITGGFWRDRQEVNRKVSLQVLWERATNEKDGYALKNFQIAAGLKQGKHQGVAWEDAWVYKWIEAACYVYASTGDQTLLRRMDSIVPIIAGAQEDDGYLATQVTAGRFTQRWIQPDNHELYNMGHLFAAAAVHHRFTGKTELVDVANRAASFCLQQFKEHADVMWEYPLNPSIIMGAVELYRATGNQDALDLARHIVNLRGSTYKGNANFPNWGRPPWGPIDNYQGGRDLYQNFIPLRREKEVVGHAVFFTYLYAGATDVYMETGDKSLLVALERLWADLTEKKMYITGGVSPVHKGSVTRSFVEGERQVCRWEPIHEGITTPYDLPNHNAYNETCGMVGNMMWNWRMLQATGDARYAEIMELSWYNSILSGVELDGAQWSYTNPLRWHGKEHELWSHDYHERHVPGLRHICCPTNVLRHVAAYQGYLFSTSEDTLWLHHYADCDASLKTLGLKLKETTNYPWDGKIQLTIQDAPDRALALKLRIPAWANKASIQVNGKSMSLATKPGSYAKVAREWKAGDTIELNLEMKTRLLAGHPRTEQFRNQVAVKRGPVVYCLESNDVKGDVAFEQIAMDAGAMFEPEFRSDLLGGVTVLKTTAKAMPDPEKAIVGQYVDITDQRMESVNVELIPYYSWNNREEPKMSVWLPLAR
ncbi:Non-reducing end beta-L-arabinofuranosidase [Planctomycetes bacterium CA13]|uniref:Non-reducing end beta-L-arabinofuranosidase n=1 Tax=Novipirellula herctigrandis TaxID=2527986 RepID=A0A5C5YLH9_9BACT|nr:Non-reducing end beta-L-arabinofuranosidase [Planctomycetes bacterium CA13]